MLCAALTLWAPSAPAAIRASIADLELHHGEGTLGVSFRIENCFTPRMEEALRNGVPATFRIRLVVERPGLLFFTGDTFLDTTLERGVRYDRLTGEFRVSLPERGEGHLVTRDFEEARGWMGEVRGLPLLPLWRLPRDEELRLRVRAELSKVNLPLHLRYVFFFVSLWDFDTEWRELSFRP